MVDCPHCGGPTTLISDPVDAVGRAGASPAWAGRKFYALAGSVMLLLVLAAAGWALHGFRKASSNPPTTTNVASPAAARSSIPHPPAAAPDERDLFAAGPVTLQKTDGSALTYAVGTVRNSSDRQRFGVKIELELMDDRDQKIGTASDYIAVLEPHADWAFRALLTQPKAVQAKVARIEEQK